MRGKRLFTLLTILALIIALMAAVPLVYGQNRGSDCGVTEITADGTQTGQWADDCKSESEGRSDAYARYYKFTLYDSRPITLTLNTTGETFVDTYLYLREGDEATAGDPLHYNDDSGDNLNSRIEETLDAGVYTIEATTFHNYRPGDFALTLTGLDGNNGGDSAHPSDCLQSASVNTVTGGQWRDDCGSYARGNSRALWYSFNLAESAEITINLAATSGDADAWLYLREGGAASGAFLYEDDDSGPGYSAEIQETLDAGSYTVEATTFGQDETGSFNLTISDGTVVMAAAAETAEANAVQGQQQSGSSASSTSGGGQQQQPVGGSTSSTETSGSKTSGTTTTNPTPEPTPAPAGPYLTADEITAITARLWMVNHGSDWWYKRTSPTGDDSCNKVTFTYNGDNNSFASLTGLTKETDYTYQAYSDNGCSNMLGTAYAFSTVAPTLSADMLTKDGARLTIGNYPANWYYKETNGSCNTPAVTVSTVTVESLTPKTEYTYTAYSDSGCTTEIASVTFTTHTAEGLPANCVESIAFGDAKKIETKGAWAADCPSITAVPADGDRGEARHYYAKYYTVSVPNGKRAAITLESTHVDPYLIVTDSDNNLFAYNDDYNGHRRRSRVEVPGGTNATYNIEATTFGTLQGAGQGFKLTVTLLNPDGSRTDCTTSLNLDGNNQVRSPKNGNHFWDGLCQSKTRPHKYYRSGPRPANAQWFTFTLAEPALVSITLNTYPTPAGDGRYYSAPDPYLYLRQGNNKTSGDFLYENDDYPDWNHTQSRIHESLAAGTYTVEATTRVGGWTGTYSLSIDARAIGKVTATTAELGIAGTDGKVPGDTNDPPQSWIWYAKFDGGTCEKVEGLATKKAIKRVRLAPGSTHTFDAYNNSACSDNGKTNTSHAGLKNARIYSTTFTTPAPTLEVTDVKGTTAKLTLGKQWVPAADGSWYFKANRSPYSSCSSAQTGHSVNLANLSPSQSYTFTAYSNSSCSNGNVIAEAEAVTMPVALTVHQVGGEDVTTATTTRLNLSPAKSGWHYKHDQSGATCTPATSSSYANVTGLATGTSHKFTAYSDNTCSSAISEVATVVTTTPTLTASNIAANSVTLTIGGWVLSKDGSNLWHKDDKGAINCSGPSEATTTSFTGFLNPGTTYTFKVYSASGCSDADEVAAAAAFITPTPTLTAAAGSNSGEIDLTLSSNWKGAWSYKSTTPAGTCANVTSNTYEVTATGLTTNTSYVFTAYSGSGCTGTVIATAGSVTAP